MQLSEYDNKIYGLQTGVLYGQNARVDELNTRICSRFSADAPLHPNIDVRPSSTKYARFPIVDFATIPKVPLPRTLDYSMATNFAPIQGNGPVDGFTTNVNVESSLRNQFFALQRAPQAAYIPSSTSDLYNTVLAQPSVVEVQPYPKLFDRYQMNPFAPVRNSDPKVGADVFLNNTRVQLRGGVLA